MRIPIHLSEESLFGFLTSTRLPIVSSLSDLIRWTSLCLCGAALLAGVGSLLFVDGGFWSARLPWSGALPALASAPLFFAAWWNWRSHRLQRAATLLFLALFALTILANWPRGIFSAAWYVHPVLCLIATMGLGVTRGLSLTLIAVSALLAATKFATAGENTAPSPIDAWTHTTSLSAVTLASALSGAIVNRLVFMALMTAEAQRRKSFESSRALRHREKLLRHALRVETIGDLAGMVCHQLRNAFQVMIGHATLAGLSDDAERTRRLHLIEQTLEQTRPLLDQLMRMAHPEDGSTITCDVNQVVADFVQQAALVLPGSIRISCDVPQEPATALLDPQGLIHALWNLVINARQAIEGDGSISLRTGVERHQIWIEVADSGSGMPPEIQARIFDPYFTTKPPGQGTGLGLTAVARYVRGSNGLIQVESTVGRGTCFRLRFPRAAGELRSETA